MDSRNKVEGRTKVSDDRDVSSRDAQTKGVMTPQKALIVSMTAILVVFAAAFIVIGEESEAVPAEGLSYNVTSGTLTISCTSSGTMPDYLPGEAPWYDQRADITAITIGAEEGRAITSIGAYAFYGFTNAGFTSYQVPANITEIGNGAFAGCSNLASFTVATGNSSFVAVNDVLYTSDYATLVAYPCAKSGTSFDVPTSSPFSADTLSSIQGGAFAGAKNLTKFTNTGHNENFYMDSDALYSKDKRLLYAYPAARTAASFSILTGCQTISAGAIMGGSNLTSISMPFTVNTIGDLAFCGCTEITVLDIPSACNSVSVFAFDGCTGLKEINVEPSNLSYYSKDGVLFKYIGSKDTPTGFMLVKYPYAHMGDGVKRTDTTGTKIYIIPYGTTEIGDYAFFGSPLKYCTFTESLTRLGYRAFMNSSLEMVQFNHGMTTLATKVGYDNVPRSETFKGCGQMLMASITNNLTSVPVDSFSGCARLTVIVVDYPDSSSLQSEPSSVTCSGGFPAFAADQYYSFSSASSGYVRQSAALSSLTAGTVYSRLDLGSSQSDLSSSQGWASYHSQATIQTHEWYADASGRTIKFGLYAGLGNMLDCGSDSYGFYEHNKPAYVMIQYGITGTGQKICRGSSIGYLYIPESVTFLEDQLMTSKNIPVLYLHRNLESMDGPASSSAVLTPFYKGQNIVEIVVSDDNDTFESYMGCLYVDGYRYSSSSDQVNTIVKPGASFESSSSLHNKNSFIAPESLRELYVTNQNGPRLTAPLIQLGNAIHHPYSVNGYGETRPTRVLSIANVSDTGIDTFSPYRIYFNSKNSTVILLPADQGNFQFRNDVEGNWYTYSLSGTEWTVDSSRVISTLSHQSTDGLSRTFLSTQGDLAIHHATNKVGGSFWWFILNEDTLVILGNDVVIDHTASAPWASYASSIKYLMLQQGITGIGEGAFSGLVNLTALCIPYSCTTIGKYAFKDCGSGVTSSPYLDYVFIPGNVTYLDPQAFAGCTYLEKLIVSDRNDHYTGTEEGVVLTKANSGAKVILCPEGKAGSYTIPDNASTVGEHAFANTTLTSVGFSNTAILDDYAFYGGDISSAILGSTVNIGNYVFADCGKLNSIIVGVNVRNIGSGAFPATLGSFQLESGTGEGAITWKTDSIPASVQWYKDFVVPIVTGGTVDYSSVSRGHIYSTSDQLPDTSYDISYGSDKTLYAVYVKESKSLIIISKDPTAVTQRMKDFTIDPDDRGWSSYLSSIEQISFYAPALANLGNNVFNGMTSVESISLPDNLKTIGNNAFANNNLTGSIAIPDSVTSIGASAFIRSSSASSGTIASLVLGSSLNSVGDYAFAGHGAIGSVIILGSSGNVTFGSNVFSTFDGTPTYTDIEFKLNGEGDAQAITESIPKKTVWIKSSSGAISVGSSIGAFVSEDVMVVIGSGDFYNYEDLQSADKSAWDGLRITTIVFAGISSISTDLFTQDGIKNHLVSISFPDTLTSVGTNAFKGCTYVYKVDLPESLISLGSGAFEGCTSLKTVSLNGNAFAATKVYMRSNAFTMGADAFKDADIQTLTSKTDVGEFTFMVPDAYKFIQAGNLMIVPVTSTTFLPIWADSEGNWVTSFEDGKSYTLGNLAGYESSTNTYTASLTTTM
ncbi:MAG: leucine-rich repeat domain-containing protein [Thermoplasmata archaeon]|nr:leucine-rich repeat domain-containing protein [Thermoplasmata archaeon]